jgi:hypothetical protein
LRCLREVLSIHRFSNWNSNLKMFHRLIRDIHYHKSIIADQLIVNMHRYIILKIA